MGFVAKHKGEALWALEGAHVGSLSIGHEERPDGRQALPGSREKREVKLSALCRAKAFWIPDIAARLDEEDGADGKADARAQERPHVPRILKPVEDDNPVQIGGCRRRWELELGKTALRGLDGGYFFGDGVADKVRLFAHKHLRMAFRCHDPYRRVPKHKVLKEVFAFDKHPSRAVAIAAVFLQPAPVLA